MFLFKRNSSVEQFSEKLEQIVQDDLAMFLEFGEDYYSLEELEREIGEARARTGKAS